MSDDSEPIELPCIGIEVPVVITPSVRSDKTWKQFGKLLAARRDPIGLVVGTIEISRTMTDEENPQRWLTDEAWVGCVVDAVFNPYSADWRATRPASDLATAVWAKCWETDNGNWQHPV
jgi:hypothetical protein